MCSWSSGHFVSQTSWPSMRASQVDLIWEQISPNKSHKFWDAEDLIWLNERNICLHSEFKTAWCTLQGQGQRFFLPLHICLCCHHHPFHRSRQACSANDLETMKCQVYSILGGGVSNINFLFQRKLKGHFNQSLLILSFTPYQWLTLVRLGMYLLNGYFRILEENECWSE